MCKTTRIQLDLPNDMLKELDSLRMEMSISTRKEFFNNALTLLFWAAKQRREQRLLLSDKDGSSMELVLPPLEKVAEKTREKNSASK